MSNQLHLKISVRQFSAGTKHRSLFYQGLLFDPNSYSMSSPVVKKALVNPNIKVKGKVSFTSIEGPSGQRLSPVSVA